MGVTLEGWSRGPGGGGVYDVNADDGEGMMVGTHGILVDDQGRRRRMAVSAALGGDGEGNGNGCKSVAHAWGGGAHPPGDGTARDDVPALSLLLSPSGDMTTTKDTIGVATDATTLELLHGGSGSGRSASGGRMDEEEDISFGEPHQR
jgi:hypothetical protein